jgi:hypothetical protein
MTDGEPNSRSSSQVGEHYLTNRACSISALFELSRLRPTMASMDKEHQTKAGRREEPARIQDAAQPDQAGKKMRERIDPERLIKAISYLNKHPRR